MRSRMRESRTSGSVEGRTLWKVRLLDPGTKPAKVKDENVIAKDLIGLLEKEVGSRWGSWRKKRSKSWMNLRIHQIPGARPPVLNCKRKMNKICRSFFLVFSMLLVATISMVMLRLEWTASMQTKIHLKCIQICFWQNILF